MTQVRTELVVLENGLTVLGEINEAHKSAGMGFFVRTGARDETIAESGISHFLEHMMFKGTKSRSALDITFDLGNIGAQANAFTSEENTVYYSAILPEYFRSLQELLSDMLEPSLDINEFDTEKKVILEEIALYQDRPHFRLYEQASRDFFNGHPAGNSVLGTTDSVSAISRDQMADYVNRRYTTENMVLAAAGNFDWQDFLELAKNLTGSWRKHAVSREYPPFNPARIEKTYTKAGLNQTHVLLLSPSCSAQDEERYALGVLATILGDHSGSKFYWDLVDKGIAEAASADIEERDHCGCFSAYASCEAMNLDEVSSIMQRVIVNALDFSDAELDRAKTKLVTRMALSSELPMGRLMSLGLEWNYRKQLHNVKEEIARIQLVARRDIENALAKFKLDSLSEFRLVAE